VVALLAVVLVVWLFVLFVCCLGCAFAFCYGVCAGFLVLYTLCFGWVLVFGDLELFWVYFG